MKKEDKTLKYEGLALPESLTDILKQDFWMLDKIGGAALEMLHLPMKFTSATVIFVKTGHCKFEINLEEFEIEAPALVNIASSDIMQPVMIPSDFEGAFMVMSQRFLKDFRHHARDAELLADFRNKHVIQIPEQMLPDFEMFNRQLRTLTSESTNRYLYQTVLHSLLSFFYHTITQCLATKEIDEGSTASHITRRFLKLARDNFKRERFLDFYAKELGITSKHLGRTIKAQTGITASEWLDRMVILEAKVLLKSSSMTIQQVAEELNFPSQSFFGKYFKNIVGVSPKEFRNA